MDNIISAVEQEVNNPETANGRTGGGTASFDAVAAWNSTGGID